MKKLLWAAIAFVFFANIAVAQKTKDNDNDGNTNDKTDGKTNDNDNQNSDDNSALVTFIVETKATCDGCKTSIEQALLNHKGIKEAELDMKKNRIRIVYASNDTNVDDIKQVISLTGHQADNVKGQGGVKHPLECCRKSAPKNNDDGKKNDNDNKGKTNDN